MGNKKYSSLLAAALQIYEYDICISVFIKVVNGRPFKYRRVVFLTFFLFLQGAAYWQAWVRGTEAVFYTLADGGRFGIFITDPEAHIIRQFSWKLEEFNKKTIAATSCPGGLVGAPLVLPPPTCPKGFAGVGCGDINE